MKTLLTVVAIILVCAGVATPFLWEALKGSHTPLDDLTITVVYDNYAAAEGLETDWGFSCLVEGAEKTILFDTGADGTILLRNMNRLGIDVSKIDAVVISHSHGDHIGGLLDHVLEQNGRITLYLPGSFTETFTNIAEEKGATIVESTEPTRICESVYTTGVLQGVVEEQALAISTAKGLIVVTGCAHPGIVHMVKAAKDVTSEDILFVMGGFHLAERHSEYIEGIIDQLKELGVRYTGPCHCSGDATRELFEREFGDAYISVGVGKVITLDDFQWMLLA
ncbi:MAG: MBL fold metallo-hydrolase [Theionarchaea archaeon]|nr:MBL fold metallo-hydrolase [Theionarchaea archaeon]